MSFINSPNMNLPIPVVGNEPGPNYATDVNNSLTLIDQHDHTPGSGVQITPSGLNINVALTFNNNFATDLAGATFTAQSSTPSNQTVYVSGVDLYYTDGNGNNVQITSGGGVAGSPGSITGLVSPASAAYIPGSSTFVWQSNVGIAANMDMGAIILRNLSPNSTFSMTVQPPAALASNSTITLPLPPASSKILTMANTGVISAVTDVDNSTLTIISNNIQVATSGITATQLASNSVTTAKILNANVTAAKLAAGIPLIVTNTYTANDSVVVPTGVSQISYIIQGGGAGGGGGGASTSASSGGGGGAGGGAGGWAQGTVSVTAGETITIVVGSAGTAGAGVLNSSGTSGGAGGVSSISSTTIGTITVSGGAAGTGGTVGTTGGGNAGGTAGTATVRGGQSVIDGGNAGRGGNGTIVSVAGTSVTALNIKTTTGASGGTASATTTTGGGGGAGGSSYYGVGGNGGNGGGVPTAGSVTANKGSGGGGGGGSGVGSNTGAAGASGVNGQVVLYWTVTT